MRDFKAILDTPGISPDDLATGFSKAFELRLRYANAEDYPAYLYHKDGKQYYFIPAFAVKSDGSIGPNEEYINAPFYLDLQFDGTFKIKERENSDANLFTIS